MAPDQDGGDGDGLFGAARDDAAAFAADDYEKVTGERLEQTLDISTWEPAHRLAEKLDQLTEDIFDAMKSEEAVKRRIREEVLPRLAAVPQAPPNAGFYSVEMADLRRVQEQVLFNGLTQAVDGTSVIFDTLPVRVVQIGVGMLNYHGDSGTWGHRIFRRDVRLQDGRLVEDAIAILERRAAEDDDNPQRNVTDMLRRGVMSFGERAVLAHKATAPWRMGHGNPLPWELLTGAGEPRLIGLSLPVLEDLLLNHQRWVFVPGTVKDRLLATIGEALWPLEYAIVQDFGAYLDKTLGGNYRGQPYLEMHHRLRSFKDEAAAKMVMGVFRVSPFAPAQVFYAHADHAHEAAMVAMADAVLIDARGFPMLLDMAERLCAGLFAAETLQRPAAAAYAQGMQHRPDAAGRPGPVRP